MRHFYIVLGDQLDHESGMLREFDPSQDTLWMAEVHGENTHVRHHKHQIVMFLSAMRHFAAEQEKLGRPVLYHRLTSDPARDRGADFRQILAADLKKHKPQTVRVVRPGDRRVLALLQQACDETGYRLEMLEDSHFFSTPADFAAHAKGRKSLRLEFFYRELRERFDFLMDTDGSPLGGQWNYDSENRETFGKTGPDRIVPPRSFSPDKIVNEVAALVESRYPDHPGKAETFRLPVTRQQSLLLLDDFIEHRLPQFGQYQDAMWEGEFFLYHSRLSTALNIKLLHPAEVCRRAEQAYHQGRAPLNAVEGFIRQILGWREYIRGVYWHFEENYREKNFLHHQRDLPEFFWTGQTDMRCLADVFRGVERHAYSHHIQRLMVSGLFCLLYGVDPAQFNDWHMATHCDAIDWVSTPNVIGMSQFADGGLLASKPYCASGAYIKRMGNYCSDCRYRPEQATGERACPFTTLYWDFLNRHQTRLATNNRLKLQLNNLKKKSPTELKEITETASLLVARFSQES